MNGKAWELIGMFVANGLLMLVVYICGHGDGYNARKKEETDEDNP